MATKTTGKSSPDSKPKSRKEKKPRPKRHFSGQDKVQAILSVWTERRKPSHVCRELKITWQQLNSWQDKALTAMIEALEPPAPAEQPKPPPLSKRLRRLLDKRTRKAPGKAIPAKADPSESLSKHSPPPAPAEEAAANEKD